MGNVRELLHGMEPGRLQTVGRMQVIPLLVEDRDMDDNRFIAPMRGAVKFSTVDYGEMKFENVSDSILIIPSHLGYVTDIAAQNHAMSGMGVMAASSKNIYSNARCIQSRQGGYISASDHEDAMIILPYALREAALRKEHVRSYSALWGDIEKFNSSYGCDVVGELDIFLTAYKKQLDAFVAEFEVIPNQCGAIILVDGEVVGFERTPSPSFWDVIWQHLIRECYGSMALVASGEIAKTPATRVALGTVGVKSLDDLSARLLEANLKEEEVVRDVVRGLLDEPFSSQECAESVVGTSLSVVTVENAQFIGQCVKDGVKYPYASLFTTAAWAGSKAWRGAKQFSI